MTDSDPKVSVDLWTARLPGLGRFVEHHWFVVRRPGIEDRWEVWQTPNAGGDSWGHLHRNLLRPSSGVGNGAGRLLRRWLGDDAVPFVERIESSPTKYPWLSRYRAFPGPNSNTFVQWVLESAYTIGWRGVGRRFASRLPASQNFGLPIRDPVGHR